jgi:hypothetical protein
MITCLVKGCTGRTRVSWFLCDDHAVEAWKEVEAVKDTPASPVAGVVVPRKKAYGVGDQWIYYLRLDEKIKIGWTSNFNQRMHSYPPHAVVIVRHPGTRADERDLHRSFKPSRAAGREWYHPTPELLAHIERMKEDNNRRFQEERAAREAARPPMPGPIQVKPRPLRGQALVRAILDGTVT